MTLAIPFPMLRGPAPDQVLASFPCQRTDADPGADGEPTKQAIRGALSFGACMDFRRPHAPLLFLAGGADRLMPAALNRANHRRYRHAGSVTDLKALPGRSHALLGQSTWREDAALVLRGLAAQAIPE